jgi:hypothetical protein
VPHQVESALAFRHDRKAQRNRLADVFGDVEHLLRASVQQFELQLAYGRPAFAGIDLAAVERRLDPRAAVGNPIAGSLDAGLEHRAQ